MNSRALALAVAFAALITVPYWMPGLYAWPRQGFAMTVFGDDVGAGDAAAQCVHGAVHHGGGRFA